MSSRWAVVPFLVLGILLALGVAQVPQPYRAWLVCALPIIGTVLYVVKQAAHLAEFKLSHPAPKEPRQRERRTYPKPSRSLRVSKGGGQQEVF